MPLGFSCLVQLDNLIQLGQLVYLGHLVELDHLRSFETVTKAGLLGSAGSFSFHVS